MSPSPPESLRIDPTIRFLLDDNRQALLRLLFGEAAPEVDQILDPVLPSTERRCDALMRVADGAGPYVLHLEFQSRVEADVPARMLGYAARALESHGLPVRSVVVYLVAPSESTPIARDYVMRWRGQARIRIEFEVVCLWQLEAEPDSLLAAPTLFALAPLLKGADERDLPALAGRVISSDWHARTKSEVVSLLALFGARRFGRQVLTLLTERLPMLQDFIQESPFYHMLRDMIRAEVLAEGRTEGRAEGRAEGRTEGRAELLLAILADRGIEVPPHIHQRIAACTDLASITRWSIAAASASCLDDIFGAGDES